jgi:hypothetical protein
MSCGWAVVFVAAFGAVRFFVVRSADYAIGRCCACHLEYLRIFCGVPWSIGIVLGISLGWG